VGIIALCDHDTTSGLLEFLSQAKAASIQGVPGIELSAEWKNGACHFLGLNIDYNNKSLKKALAKIRNSREGRNELILEKLKSLGMKISSSDVSKQSGKEVITRPHIAKALRKKGYVKTIKESFDKYLKKGGPAYAERFCLQPEEAIELLKKAGGKVIIAHPAQLNMDLEEFDRWIKKWKKIGLDGVEAFSPGTNTELCNNFMEIALKNNLIITCGSDFHGDNKPGRRPGYSAKTARESIRNSDLVRRNMDRLLNL